MKCYTIGNAKSSVCLHPIVSWLTHQLILASFLFFETIFFLKKKESLAHLNLILSIPNYNWLDWLVLSYS